MTITVTEDIVEGQSVAFTANGPAGTRVFRVKTTAQETMFEILQDASIPQYGDAYPNTGGTGQPAFIYAVEISCVPLERDNSVYEVVVNYARPDFSQKEPSEDSADSVIQVGSSVTSGKTQKDKDGNQIVVSLSGEPDQVGDVDIQTPETVLVFERRESNNPVTKSLANVGKVNSVALGSGTYAVRTLLCLGIEGVSTDDGETWQVSYRFQYRPGTWDATIVYIDPETDRPHDDIDLSTAGTGWVEEQIYDTVDFTSLSLPF